MKRDIFAFNSVNVHYLRKGAGRRSFKLRFGDKISFWKIINKIQRDRVNVISVPLLVCLSFYHWIWACKICKQKLCFIYFHFFREIKKTSRAHSKSHNWCSLIQMWTRSSWWSGSPKLNRIHILRNNKSNSDFNLHLVTVFSI